MNGDLDSLKDSDLLMFIMENIPKNTLKNPFNGMPNSSRALETHKYLQKMKTNIKTDY